MQKEVFTAALLSAVSLTAAQAQDAPLERHIGLSGHYVEADDERDVDYGYGFSVLIGHQLFDADSPVYLEGIFSTTSLETGVEGFTDFYQYQLGLDLAYRFGDRSGLTPFLFLGGGAIYDDVTPDSLDATEPYANAGLGLVSAPLGSWDVKLRGDARYIYDWFQDGFGDVRVAFGLEIPITETVPPPPPPVPPPAPDVKVVEPPPLPDGDRDGVPDPYDFCKNTPPAAEVNECGCAIGEVLQLRGVKFEFNSARLTVNAQAILDSIAKTVMHYDAVQAEIAGHSDSLGPEGYNQSLSEERAGVVRDYLVQRGVAANRLTAAGYGESEPIADNSTEEGRERNRRVELRIR